MAEGTHRATSPQADGRAPLPPWAVVGPALISLICLTAGVAFLFPEIEDTSGSAFLFITAGVSLLLGWYLRRGSIPHRRHWYLIAAGLVVLSGPLAVLALTTVFLNFGVTGSGLALLALTFFWSAASVLAAMRPDASEFLRALAIGAAVLALLISIAGWFSASEAPVEGALAMLIGLPL